MTGFDIGYVEPSGFIARDVTCNTLRITKLFSTLLSCRSTQIENNYLRPIHKEITPMKLNRSVGRLESKYSNRERTGMTRVRFRIFELKSPASHLLLPTCMALLVTRCLPGSDE
jgi:hypothetical protein